MSLYDIDWFVEDYAKDKRSSVPQLPPLNTSTLTRLSVASRRHSFSSLPRDVENQVPVSVSPESGSPWFHPYLQTSGGAVFFPVGLGRTILSGSDE
jgi:hypothetical protein